MTNKLKKITAKYRWELGIVLFSLIFSWWLMFSTFSYGNGYLLISTKAWSDFASHIPLIRSFAFGNNFPPQYPLFSGPAIKYHFLFYALVGLLEKSGIRIDYAFNVPSALGFMFLILMIYIFAKEVFKSRAIGILSILFFLFNSSLDFINFLISHPLSVNTFKDIISNTAFPSFGPYDGKVISAFWNLNIYTNQRHLALSYAFSLLLIYLVLKTKEKNLQSGIKYSLILGIALGLSFFLNIAVYLMTIIILICIFILFHNKRLISFIIISVAGLVGLPQYLYIQSGASEFKPIIHLGYLVTNLNLGSFIYYWWQNLGLSLILIPVGFIMATRFEKKVFLTFLSLFLVGNLFQFSPEVAANHKFFNYFILVGNMLSALLIVKLWGKNIYLKTLSFYLVIFMILSGMIDFFPIFNDHFIPLADYPVSKNVSWIMRNTPPNSVFLNTNYLYDEASLAGRKIFLGWPYFAWSQGYDTTSRDDLRKAMLDSNNLDFLCHNLVVNKINYIEINPLSSDATVNKQIFDDNFKKVYANGNTILYSTGKTCSGG